MQKLEEQYNELIIKLHYELKANFVLSITASLSTIELFRKKSQIVHHFSHKWFYMWGFSGFNGYTSCTFLQERILPANCQESSQLLTFTHSTFKICCSIRAKHTLFPDIVQLAPNYDKASKAWQFLSSVELYGCISGPEFTIVLAKTQSVVLH